MELQNALYTNFSNIESAFSFFAKKNTCNPENPESPGSTKEIYLNAFKESLDSLLPRRFSDSEMNFLWQKITGKGQKLSSDAFAEFLNPNKFIKEDLKTL